MRKMSFLFWLFGSMLCAQNVSFDKANTLYNNGDYAAAISLYEQILEDNQHSSELYFNLANCYYKLNMVGPSIYFYEKALLLEPNDSDIINNLGFARKMTIDNINEIPKLGLVKFTSAIINRLKADQWAVVCVSLMMFFVLFFITYYLTEKTRLKRLFFVLEGLVLILLIVSFGLMTKKVKLEQDIKHAIIFSQEVALKSDPNPRSETVFLLHEGTKIQLLQSFSDSWTKIQLKDGKIGWLPNSAFRSF